MYVFGPLVRFPVRAPAQVAGLVPIGAHPRGNQCFSLSLANQKHLHVFGVMVIDTSVTTHWGRQLANEPMMVEP